jgi:NADPH:quinone reductase-like Zn-dependent oxidoreductase
MKAAVVVPGQKAVNVREIEKPQAGRGEVLVRVRAASLNFRDLIVAQGMYTGATDSAPLIPLSDGAGEVIETGEGVTRWQRGDRVVSSFFQGWVDGAFLPAHMATALGGGIDGVLAEYCVFKEHGLARMPAHLSFEQGSTLPCAALTAWHALFEKGPLRPGETVLVLGSGGVSLFALQFAQLAGAKVIATSSSDEKLDRLKNMGAAGLVNYRAQPDWQDSVLELTGGTGVDHVIEVGGGGTFERSLAACRTGGRVSLIGRLTGVEDRVDPRPIMAKGLTVQGIYVGSLAMLERMNAAVSSSAIEPVIDRVFPFDETAEAYEHLASGKHFGKVVIRI